MMKNFLHFVSVLTIALTITACQTAVSPTIPAETEDNTKNIPYSNGPTEPPVVTGPTTPPPSVEPQAVTEKENIILTLPVEE